MENKDGYYRLQVERYESLELNNFKGPRVSIDVKTSFSLKEQLDDDVSNETLVRIFFSKNFYYVFHSISERFTEEIHG